MLTAVGAHGGVARGVPCLLGVTAGMALMMFVVPLGLGGLVLTHPLVLSSLHWAGACFLLWMSWKIATSSSRLEARPPDRSVGFVAAASFQWVNPKSWLVSASAAGTFLDPHAGGALAQAAAFGGLFALAALPGCFVWLAFGATAQRALRTERALRSFNVVMGVLLALSIVLIVR